MVRMRQFTEQNVLEAARDRLDRTLEGCDRIAVSYSGGKDSLALMHLVREAQQRAGDPRPVLATFRDMEFVNESVLAKVRETFALEWVEGHWLCLPAGMRTTIAGHPLDVIAWEEGREWARPMPEQAEVLRFTPQRAITDAETDAHVAGLSKGRVVIATGLRAAESLIRYRAIANKLSEPWLAKSKAPGVTLARPMYDWQEADVLKYLLEVGETPAAIYDAQVWAGKGDLRTASLLANEQMRDLTTLKVTDPDAYATLLEHHPEVAVSERYDRDLADRHNVGQKAETWLQLRRWIDARYAGHPRAHRRALDRMSFGRDLARKNPGGFPPWWVQHEIARDGHGTGMMPLPVDHPSRKDTPA